MKSRCRDSAEINRFKRRLLTNDVVDRLNYQASATTEGSAWEPPHSPLAEFRKTFRRRAVPTAPRLDLARIRATGLMVAPNPAGSSALNRRRISRF